MVYRTEEMVLSSTQEVLRGAANDVLICQDLHAPMPMFYTLLVIKDRACAKAVLQTLAEGAESGRDGNDRERGILKCFSHDESLCYLFPYRPERRLATFAKGQMTSLYLREQICINLVMECLSCRLPDPLLYLILEQGLVHLEKDNTVYFSLELDLSKLDGSKTEADCTRLCVLQILELLELGKRKRNRTKSHELLRRKIEKNAYQSFPELYRDIKVTAVPEQKEGWRSRLTGWWRRNKDRLFHVLITVCVILAVIALVIFLSQLIFGDVPLFRLFEHSFDVIGTETLR